MGQYFLQRLCLESKNLFGKVLKILNSVFSFAKT